MQKTEEIVVTVTAGQRPRVFQRKNQEGRDTTAHMCLNVQG